MKWLIIGLGVSLLPIWRDVSTGEGLNLWEYIYSTAIIQRKHITPEEAIRNYCVRQNSLASYQAAYPA